MGVKSRFFRLFSRKLGIFDNFNPIFFVVAEDVIKALASIANKLSKMGSFIFTSHRDLDL